MGSDPFARLWSLLALRGVAGIALAVVAVIWPFLTLEALLFGFGVYVTIDGAFALYAGLIRHEHGYPFWPFVGEGVLGILFGATVVAFPDAMAFALWYLVAGWAVATGVFELVAAVRIRQLYEGETMLAGAGAVSIVFGVVMMLWPRQAMVGLSWLIGVYSAGFGLLLFVLSARLYTLAHPRPRSASQPVGTHGHEHG
jgi:uncharacterized membrane protein HdeD (DUF308 family)